MKTSHSLSSPRAKVRISEWLARGLVLGLLVGLPLAVLVSRLQIGNASYDKPVEIHARMPEQDGWSIDSLTIMAGQPLNLRLVSDDVLHSFKIGQSTDPAIDLLPGKTVETSQTFDQPGKYTFYCTRWCGPNHWRMRGTIEVLPTSGDAAPSVDQAGSPLYVSLGLDIDAPHPAQVTPQRKPSAAQGIVLDIRLPATYLSQTLYRTHSPVQAWEILRHDPLSADLSDQDVWDLVALIWSTNIGVQDLATGRELYAQNCAACHGESGAGDGVFATHTNPERSMQAHAQKSPADFTDPSGMLGASPALLQGKIVRGGMGTGMPYWGPIFTEDQIWALVDALYAFQFKLEVEK